MVGDIRRAATSADASIIFNVTSWRDLGNGRNPFDAAWRAHGEIGGSEPGSGGDVLRLAGFRKGEIRRMYERGVVGRGMC
jgi:cytosine/adenosine deaminase-related metal-dependent hydrolase